MKREKKWYQKISNWLVILACIILIPILVINIYIMIQANTNKDEIPQVFGYKPFIVLSGSMESKIHKGDLILTKNIDPEDLKKNDVIAFRDDQETVTTHRIIDIVEKDGNHYFVTKGDNNDSQDKSLVEYKDVEGIYVGRIPGIGSVMDALAKPTTIIIVVLVITLIFGICYVQSNKKLRAEEQAEFLEYKKMKEAERASKEAAEEKKAAPKKTTRKTTPKKK